MDELKTVNCEQLMTTPLKPIEFCVDGMISTGLFILAGAPKIGKSWLALDISHIRDIRTSKFGKTDLAL